MAYTPAAAITRQEGTWEEASCLKKEIEREKGMGKKETERQKGRQEVEADAPTEKQ